MASSIWRTKHLTFAGKGVSGAVENVVRLCVATSLPSPLPHYATPVRTLDLGPTQTLSDEHKE